MRSLPITLALLSSATSSSHSTSSSSTPSAFSHNNYPPSTRIRRRALAQSLLLHALPTADNKHGSSEFTRRHVGSTPSTTDAPSLSPSSTLGMMVDSQREFEINLGRAVDTLKRDYPKLLTQNPDFKIYSQNLEVIDPAGVSLHGLNNYKSAFMFIHAIVGLFYDEGKSGLNVRTGYDWARKCIRVSWNVELVPRLIYGGTRNMLHVDGISEYYLDRETGLINEHRVSHLVINGDHVRPANGIFNALAEISPIDPEHVPVYSKWVNPSDATSLEGVEWTKVNFQTWNPLSSILSGQSPTTSSLFAESSEQAMSLNNAQASGDYTQVPYDRDALQRKNASRKKFGMPPITPEEFIKIEEEVRALDVINKKKASQMAQQLVSSRKKEEKDNFLSNIFGGALKNGCESNFDCERPQVCCDVGFKKICCSNGLGIVDGIPVERYERGLLRMPLPNDNYDY